MCVSVRPKARLQSRGRAVGGLSGKAVCRASWLVGACCGMRAVRYHTSMYCRSTSAVPLYRSRSASTTCPTLRMWPPAIKARPSKEQMPGFFMYPCGTAAALDQS